VFEGGGGNGNDPTVVAACLIYDGCSGGVQGVPFRMHVVVGDALSLDWGEGAKADMKCERADNNTTSTQGV
jgi:hypothetical protein